MSEQFKSALIRALIICRHWHRDRPHDLGDD
jgi:hypothetical protein